MKKNIIFILLFFSTTIYSQINIADSSAQVIGYWSKGEKQNYTIKNEKLRIKNQDTISNTKFNYDVEITVLDSTENSYTLQWAYSNFDSNDPTPYIQKLVSLTDSIKIIYKTDEYGAFKEIINADEVLSYYKKLVAGLKSEFQLTPEQQTFLQQLEAQYSNKETLESNGIKEIIQFHNFHGAKYEINKTYTGKMQVPNIFGNKPFDADVSALLDEINNDENNFVVRSSQVVNQKQLVDAVYSYLNNMAKTMKIAMPKKNEFKNMQNDVQTASRIHGSGWIIYSVQTKTVSIDEDITVEERVIEII